MRNEPLIMLVDDDATNLVLLGKRLAVLGYKNIVSIQDARMVLPGFSESPPDLILLDYTMPHLNGAEVIAQLKEGVDDDLPPILILTGHCWDDEKISRVGASGVLRKPYSIDDLNNALSLFLECD